MTAPVDPLLSLVARLRDEMLGVCDEAADALTALQQQLSELRKGSDSVLDAPMAAGLLLTLKQECEQQHARAEAAEADLSRLRTVIEKYAHHDDECDGLRIVRGRMSLPCSCGFAAALGSLEPGS